MPKTRMPVQGQPPGRKIRCPGGYSAFVPAPLPPALLWTRQLVSSLSSADRAVGRLAGEGGRLPNPHLLIRPFVRREVLITLFLVERKILPTPLLYLSAFFEATRQEYYQRLRAVTERGEWSAWLGYFLDGVARQAEDALNRAERINALLTQWRLATARFSSRAPAALVDLLAENPYWTVKRVAERLSVAYTTAQRAVEALESLSVLTRIGDAKRHRVYCAKPILEILEEPAKLAPARTD
jgi:Fic/DOC family protein